MKFSLPGGRALEMRREKDGGYALSVVRSGDPNITVDQYIAMYYQGLQYGLMQQGQTIKGHHEDISNGFANYVQGAYKSNGIVFACMLARMMAFSEVRFQWRKFNKERVPADLWGSPELKILENPWPNATTGDLLSRAIQDVDLAGNFYATRDRGQIKRLRPDWVSIVVGSPNDPSVELGDIEAEVVGYLYHPGGPGANKKPVPLLREQVCHFAPIPDPTASFRGMSWITPILREVMSDTAATAHKLAFFQNGATVNHVITMDPAIGKEAFDEWINTFEAGHKGAVNAYKTWYLGGGATYTPIGANFQQMEFKVTQGAGEVRIAAAAGVPPTWINLSDALQGSSLNAGNKAADRRRFADGTIRPLWRNFCGSMATLVNVPGMSELWYDDRDVAFLREDRKDAAEIHSVEATSINTLIMAGYEPDYVIEAVVSGDYSRLKSHHTGLFSVQLQPPLTVMPVADAPNEPAPNGKASPNGKSVQAGRSTEPATSILNLEPHLHFAEGFVKTGETHVTFEDGAIQAGTTIADGAIQAHHTVEAGAFPVDARTTIAKGAVEVDARTEIADGAIRTEVDARTSIEAGAVPVDARTTIAEGAVQATTTIADGAVRANVDARTSIEPGAIPVDARTTIEEGAIRAETTIAEGAIPIDARTEIAEGAIQADVDARTEIAEGAFRAETTVEPAQVNNTFEAPETPKPRNRKIRVKRPDGKETTATIEEE